jgi:hypothetical protein
MQNQSLTYVAVGAQDTQPPTGNWVQLKSLSDGGLWTWSNLLANNSGGDPINLQVVSINEDGISPGFPPGVVTWSPGFGFNGSTFDRLRSQGNDADDVATNSTGVSKVAAFSYGFDGSTWDRIRSGSNAADAVATSATGNRATLSYALGFNGTAFDRLRTASAATQSASTQTGILAVANVGTWSITHTPTTNTQATITRAAGAAGVRHVCTSISCALSAPATATSGVVQINLRDGATGAGTILWSNTLQVGGATSISAGLAGFAISGLSITGSAATAMTLEFSAAGGANTSESVSMTGYDTV